MSGAMARAIEGGGSGAGPCGCHLPRPDDRQAAALYRAFNGFAATDVRKVRHARLMPPVVVELGELRGLIYRSDKFKPSEPSTYIHVMEAPAILASNPEGTQLYIIGGDYRVTERGIEG
jgi:hypothetical protein